MKFKCINNKKAEHLLTIGKIYKGEEHEEGIRVYDLDDGKGGGTLLKSRFEIIKQGENND